MVRSITIAVLLLSAATFSCAGDNDVESVVDKNGEDAAVTKISEVSEEGASETVEPVIVESDVTETEAEVEVTETSAAVCPECGSGNVLGIIYGKPSQELSEKAERGEVKLGGCVISRESPYNYCKDCKAEWLALTE
jgi:hypothetical protein